MIEFEDFEDEAFGLTLPDLEITPANPLPDLPPRWARRWWHEGEGGQPAFDTLEDRALHDIERYARPLLARLGASDDDAVLEHKGAMMSLNDLVAMFSVSP